MSGSFQQCTTFLITLCTCLSFESLKGMEDEIPVSTQRLNLPFVTCDMRGGLGNQLFEIATTLAYAWDYGAIPIFPDFNRSTYRLNDHRDKLFFRLMFRPATSFQRALFRNLLALVLRQSPSSLTRNSMAIFSPGNDSKPLQRPAFRAVCSSSICPGLFESKVQRSHFPPKNGVRSRADSQFVQALRRKSTILSEWNIIKRRCSSFLRIPFLSSLGIE